MALSDVLAYLADPQLVVRFQKFCGVEYQRGDPDNLQPGREHFVVQPTKYNVNNSPYNLEAAAAENGGDYIDPGNATDARWREKQTGLLLPQQVRQHTVAVLDCTHTLPHNNCTDFVNGSVVSKKEPGHNDGKKLQNGHSDHIANENGTLNGFTLPVLNGLRNDLTNHCRQTSLGSNSTDSAVKHRPRVVAGCTQSARNDSACVSSLSNSSQSKPCVNGSFGSAMTANNNPSSSLAHPPVLIRYPFLYYLAHVGAFLGNEEFYLSGLPFMVWMVDAAMMRQVIIVWGTVMYLGQAFKDYLQWARPPAPPLVRLESSHLDEFSMPSTHATAGTAIPMVFATLVLERYDFPTIPVVCLAILWFLTTCFSRLYLGVHTVLDLLAGIAIALAVYAIECPLISTLDVFQQTHPLAPIPMLALAVALSTVCYPSNHAPTGKSNAITISTVIIGLFLGCWLNYQLGYSVMKPLPLARAPVSMPSRSWLVKSVLQLGIGVSVVFAMKLLLKVVTVRALSAWYGLPRPDPKHPGVLVGYTYITYGLLGVTVSFVDPLIFHALGFGRAGYYTEVV